jgi:hypothetical protein
MIDDAALGECSQMIAINHRTLDDLPRELADTISNIYYRLCLGGGLQIDFKSFDQSIEQFNRDSAFLISTTKALPEMVAELRSIGSQHGTGSFEQGAQILLDILKYRIPNVHEKSAMRRAVERKLSRKGLPEIQNLYQFVRPLLPR